MSRTNKKEILYKDHFKIKMPEDDFDKSFSTLISKLGKTTVV